MEDNETDLVAQILCGLRFYNIYPFESENVISVCTYRKKNQVSEVFGDNAWIMEINDQDSILWELKYGDGFYCVELHNTYKGLKSLAEDIMISKLSGMMEKEI